MILLSNLLSEDRTGSPLVLHVSILMMMMWLMMKQHIFATLEISMTTSITKITEATFSLLTGSGLYLSYCCAADMSFRLRCLPALQVLQALVWRWNGTCGRDAVYMAATCGVVLYKH